MMRALILSITLVLTSTLFALPTDRLELAYVEADLVNIDSQTALGHYEGHVKFAQGSSHLTADKVKTQFNEQHHLTYAIAETTLPELTHFWIQPQLNAPLFHAYATTIEYFPDKHLLILTGSAHIAQGDNKLSAPIIQYHLDSKQLTTTKSGNEKTHIWVNPTKDAYGHTRSP